MFNSMILVVMLMQGYVSIPLSAVSIQCFHTVQMPVYMYMCVFICLYVKNTYTI